MTGAPVRFLHIRIFVNGSFYWHQISPSQSDPRSEPIAITGPFSGLYNLTSGRRVSGCTNFPLSRARAQENKTNLKIGG